MSNIRWLQMSTRGRRKRQEVADKLAGNLYAPLKLRREPDEFWTGPRKASGSVTLPRLKCLEKTDQD